jgi:hypothetical protein
MARGWDFHSTQAIRIMKLGLNSAHAESTLLRGFEQALLGFFLALDAMARPRYGFETLGVDFLAAGDAFSKAAFANASESSIHHVEQLAIVIALAEEKFLVIGAGGAIGNVLRGLFVGGTTVLLIADNHVAQFPAPGLESFSKRL